MYAVAKEYTEEEDEFELTEEQVNELDRRKEAWLKGDNAGHTWADAKEVIVGRKS
jgi:hypothetical protein